MDLNIHIDQDHLQIPNIKFQKMVLLYNAMEDGWTIQKKQESYIFSKKHEGKKEVLLDSYITQFLQSNMDISKLLK